MKKLCYALGMGLNFIAIVLALPTAILTDISGLFIKWSGVNNKEDEEKGGQE